MMRITVEISMYPLRDDYIPPIDAFIAKLHEFTGLVVTTDATATQLTGNYDVVMAALTSAIAWSYATAGKAVFVTKFIPGYEA
jgi:uncharacterized protein YqgV (UPF0045/DUF77 family)